MINRTALCTALAKAVAFKSSGNRPEAAKWLAELKRLIATELE